MRWVYSIRWMNIYDIAESVLLDTQTPEQKGWFISHDIFAYVFLNKKAYIDSSVNEKFKLGSTDTWPLVDVMA